MPISSTSSIEALAIAFTKMAEQERAVARIRQEQDVLKTVTNGMREQINAIATRQDNMDGDTGYQTVVAFCRSEGIHAPLEFAKKFGVMCANMCRQLNIRIGRVPDERWKNVNSYPVELMKTCYTAMHQQESRL